MKEIIIRGWDKRKKTMIEDLLCFYPPNSEFQKNPYWGISHSNEFNKKDGYMWNVRDLEIMLYSGYKDVAGRRVYQSDIVNFKIRGVRSTVPLRGEIVFFKPCEMKIDMINFIYSNERYYAITNKVEVIGNIYQNPELRVKNYVSVELNKKIKTEIKKIRRRRKNEMEQ